MAISKFFSLFLLLITTMSSPSSAARPQSATFIRTSCNSTSFPELCFSSLSKYASAVQENRLQLAQVATEISLSNLNTASTKVSSLYKKSLLANSTKDAKPLEALKDCTELLSDATDNTQYSLSELKKLNGTGGGATAVWGLSNAQTYMSAALTKEDTCTDGMNEMGAAVKDVSGRVGKAKQYTSNALALVNRLRYTYY